MTPPTSATDVDPSVDPFRYGWRFVKVTQPDGSTDLAEIPLTLEDVLHPEEGDVIPEAMYHESERRYLSDVLRTVPFGPPVTLVTSDLLVNWGIKGLRAVSPDIGAFVELSAEPDPALGTLRLKKFGGRCLLVIEIVSPDKRENDVKHKVRYYHRVGVPLYVLVDQEEEGGPRTIRAYQWTPKNYVAVPLDAEGRVALSPLGLLLGLRDERVVCYDAATGAVVGDYTELARTIQSLEQQREESEKAHEETLLRAQAAEREAAALKHKSAALRKSKSLALKAKRAADQRADAEARTREEAVRCANLAQERADLAQQRADLEAQARRLADAARLAAEQRLHEMEQTLRRLQGTSPT